MKTLKEKQLAFLEETANHYNTTNRCFGKFTCKYSPISANLEGISEGCAIGRKLSPELALELDENGGGDVSIIFDQLPKKLKELNKSFLSDVQHLHDESDYWDVNGLSKKGKEKVEQIKNNYNLIS